MARDNTKTFGLVAIVVSGMLVMGGLMFLLTGSFMSQLPQIFLIPPIVQISLGLLGSLAGFYLWRGHSNAKFVLLFVAIAVVANGAFLVYLMLTMAGFI